MKSRCSGNGIKVFHRQVMHFIRIEINGDFVQIAKLTLNEIEEFVLDIRSNLFKKSIQRSLNQIIFSQYIPLNIKS